MRPPLRTERPPIGMNMTPLIDVVFLLIIFFLVSSHLARQETQLALDLPTASTAEDATAEGRPRVSVNVLADGRVLLGAAETQPEEITERLQYERERSGDDLEIRIRSDRSVPYGVVEPILLACADAGIWNVTFAVYERGQRPEVRGQ